MTAINIIFIVQIVCSLLMYFFVKHVDTKETDDKWCDTLELVGSDRVKYTNIVNTLIFTILAIPYTFVMLTVFIYTLITMPFRGNNND